MLTKRTALAVFVTLIVLAMAPFAMAMPDPFATLCVWPYGTPEGAEGPIVTTSPADMIIYNTDNSHVLTDLWLMLVINSPAYHHMLSIYTNFSLTFHKTDFREIEGTVSPSHKIPLSPPGSETPAFPLPPDPANWPGMEPDDQYDVGSLRSKLGIPKIMDADYQSMYYAVADMDSHPGWEDHGPPGLNKHDPEYFEITVDLDPAWEGGPWRVLVLALGYDDNGMHTVPYMLNVHSPYTRSTLIVSELRTLLLALAPLSAFGLYKIRHKIRKK